MTSSAEAASSQPTGAKEDPPIQHWKLAREGVSMLLNNKQEEAEALFKAYPDSLEMSTGYVYAVFTDALMSFEDDKIQICLQSMKDLEKKCSTYYSTSWLKIVKSKVFGSDGGSMQKELECQIILADTHVFVAMLTFLQQDFSGFIKGSWMLRKSYKYYQTAYNSILNLYKEIVGDDNIPHVSEQLVELLVPQPDSTSKTSAGASKMGSPKRSITQTTQSQPVAASSEILELASLMECRDPIYVDHLIVNEQSKATTATPIQNTRRSDATVESTGAGSSQPRPSQPPVLNTNGYLSPLHRSPHPKHSISFHAGLGTRNGYVSAASDDRKFRPFMKRSTSANSGLSTSPSFFAIPSFHLFNYGNAAKDLDRDTITRLLCAVSFGYGLLQLGISLLPPTMLKVVSFFGFSGSRKVGIANLMYARRGDDLRAPFATLTLLWYHTIVRPFFALDGTNVNAGVRAAAELIEETREEFHESALFLFFRGRVERLQSKIPMAITTFQLAITNAAQREIKLMSMHEVGWCYLIELNFGPTESAFQYLKEQSRWSKPFYSYLCLIAAGSNGMFQQTQNAIELRNGFQPVPKGTQLEEFLVRRYKICPLEETTLKQLDFVYWKLLAYELLYLWNTLPSCNKRNLGKIIKDCDQAWTLHVEPFLGLSKLIQGTCHCILGKYEEGVNCFREGIEARKEISANSDDAHVSAFTKFELGLILIRNSETLSEGRVLLEMVSTSYKGYDFEQRLVVRVYAILKNL